MSQPVLQIIIASTRPGRVGLPVPQWFEGVARQQGSFEVEVLNLTVVALPLLDEPGHPVARQYVHSHSIAWSETIERGDAFGLVHPEYNHNYNPALTNALDYLHGEWRYQRVGFVSYGGVSAGTRTQAPLKPVLGALRMTPTTEAVNIPLVAQFIDDEGHFAPNEVLAV